MVIYVHIPFCIKKCLYCDFLSGPCDDFSKEKYVKSLLYEISYYGKKYGKEGRDIIVSSVFFGGGTPSILDETLMSSIIKQLRDSFTIEENAEITIECNPGTLSADKLRIYKQSGVNRLSIGLQSANDDELKNIGRIHTYEDFVRSYYMARECGFDNINIDLMSALPGQTLKSYKETLEKIVNLNPEHISSYSLILEEGTPLYDRIEKLEKNGEDTGLPDEDTEREMYYLTKKILSDNGFERYEISSYSKKGYECRHNIAYWIRDNYLGLGLGASSCMDNIRRKNTDDMKRYMEVFCNDHVKDISDSGVLNEEETAVLSEKDMMAEFMFLGLRMISGISKQKFKRCFGKDYDTIYGGVTEKLIKEGLAEIFDDGDRICLSEKGIDVSNSIFVNFILD